MTRAEFAEPIAEEVGVPLVTILTALSILATTLPQLIALCQPPKPEPVEVQVRRLCTHRKVKARKEIRKTFPPKMRGKVRAARAICDRIAASSLVNIRTMLTERNVVPGQSV